ncbi:uncharacterized protein PgNI_12096 [Pyricularia grisea]|uniref:Uncharacterized protein n=1 Tax=Pyricularia grisea TaxID=148305 RepID=A0A6P8AQF8_PYRGI|nr:uncharacterized protein PgNI_12096 [Pyricularia grisea]TLD04283.1 hypothetical protein PgNI_12096 [Pyricularia grisea]
MDTLGNIYDRKNKKYAKIGAKLGTKQNLNQINYNPFPTIKKNPIFIGEKETGIEQPPPNEKPLRIFSGFISDKNFKP